MELAPKITALEERRGTSYGDDALALPWANGMRVLLPLSDYPDHTSTSGFMRFLLAAKNLKHLSTACQGVFHTPCLLGVFARLHSLHWDFNAVDQEPWDHVGALSKLRQSLWQLAQAVARPEHRLEPADVQLLSSTTGEHADIVADLAPLAKWLAQDEWATLVAEGWNEQEERGPNDDPMFYPPYEIPDYSKDAPDIDHRYTISSGYEDPRFNVRL